jgi:hypothetical protein
MVADLSRRVVMIVMIMIMVMVMVMPMVMTMIAVTMRGTALGGLSCRTVATAPQPHELGRQ